MGIINKTTQRIVVLGIKVAEVEITREFAQKLGGTERGENGISNGSLAINPDYITPILAKAVNLSIGLTPEIFHFDDGSVIVVNGNIDEYTGTQELKTMFSEANAGRVVLGTARLIKDIDLGSVGAMGAFLNQINMIVHDNWEEQKAPTQ